MTSFGVTSPFGHGSVNDGLPPFRAFEFNVGVDRSRPRPWKNGFAEYGGPTFAVRLRQVSELIQALRPGLFAAAVQHQ
jgi:hypothetical protein